MKIKALIVLMLVMLSCADSQPDPRSGEVCPLVELIDINGDTIVLQMDTTRQITTGGHAVKDERVIIQKKQTIQ